MIKHHALEKIERMRVIENPQISARIFPKNNRQSFLRIRKKHSNSRFDIKKDTFPIRGSFEFFF